MTYRIHRSTRPGTDLFALSGVLDAHLADKLKEMLTGTGGGHVVLDLRDVTLVDRDAVRFLAGVELAGTEIVNCPDYVRSWIAAESGSDTEEASE